MLQEQKPTLTHEDTEAAYLKQAVQHSELKGNLRSWPEPASKGTEAVSSPGTSRHSGDCGDRIRTSQSQGGSCIFILAPLDSDLLFQQWVWFGTLAHPQEEEGGVSHGSDHGCNSCEGAAPQDKIRAAPTQQWGERDACWADTNQPSQIVPPRS